MSAPASKHLVYRLSQLIGLLKKDRLTRRERIYLDAVLNHYFNTTQEWKNQ